MYILTHSNYITRLAMSINTLNDQIAKGRAIILNRASSSSTEASQPGPSTEASQPGPSTEASQPGPSTEASQPGPLTELPRRASTIVTRVTRSQSATSTPTKNANTSKPQANSDSVKRARDELLSTIPGGKKKVTQLDPVLE